MEVEDSKMIILFASPAECSSFSLETCKNKTISVKLNFDKWKRPNWGNCFSKMKIEMHTNRVPYKKKGRK